MIDKLSLTKHTIHLWRINLHNFAAQEEELINLLASDEIERANNFKFSIHRKRFIIARALLRSILGNYLKVSPETIIFSYGKRGKPFLQENTQNLQFNLSHSEDVAILALTKEFEIGVDIQKIEKKDFDGIAKRFFSENEYAVLKKISDPKKAEAFFRLWTLKEALIKATGEGLYVPLGNFSISLLKPSQFILLIHENRQEKYYLKAFYTFNGFQSAFATNQEVEKIEYFEWDESGPHLLQSFK